MVVPRQAVTGNSNPISSRFQDMSQFTSALFSADLGSSTFLLSDGTVLVANSSPLAASARIGKTHHNGFAELNP